MKRILSAVLLALAALPARAAKEDYLNIPGLIDAHAHVGRYSGYDFQLDTLLSAMELNNVEAALVSNLDGGAVPGRTANLDEAAVNEETRRICDANPKLKPLAWARPGASGGNPEKIEPFLRDHGFRGVKFHPEFNDFDANAPIVLAYLRLCERYGVPAVFHSGGRGRSHPELIYAAARRFPKVPFILYHMGFGTDHQAAIQVARQAKAKEDALLYLEISQCDASAVLQAVQAVGADRVLFGTDATYYGKNHYQKYVPVLKRLEGALTPEDFRKIVHDNAAQLFKL